MILTTVFLAGALAGVPEGLADLALPDQYGERDTLAAHRGRAVVVMVVTARRLRNLKAWERDLRERFDDVDFVRVADVPEEPPATLERVAAKLVQRVPADVRVLIDLDRRWAKTLALDTDLPNLVVFDPGGRLVARFRGRSGGDLLDQVSQALDSLRGDR